MRIEEIVYVERLKPIHFRGDNKREGGKKWFECVHECRSSTAFLYWPTPYKTGPGEAELVLKYVPRGNLLCCCCCSRCLLYERQSSINLHHATWRFLTPRFPPSLFLCSRSSPSPQNNIRISKPLRAVWRAHHGPAQSYRLCAYLHLNPPIRPFWKGKRASAWNGLKPDSIARPLRNTQSIWNYSLPSLCARIKV